MEYENVLKLIVVTVRDEYSYEYVGIFVKWFFKKISNLHCWIHLHM